MLSTSAGKTQYVFNAIFLLICHPPPQKKVKKQKETV